LCAENASSANFVPWSGSTLSSKSPVFPDEVTSIGILSVSKLGSQIVYLSPEGKPILAHDEGDIQTFRFATSQFYVFGHFKLLDIVRVFGVSASSVRAAVKLYLAHGAEGFYRSPKRKDRDLKVGSIREQIRQVRLENADALAMVSKAQADALEDGTS
jgi:hypothetical protein